MPRVVVAGGSGGIGKVLVPELEKAGYEVVILSRSPGPGRVQWDAHKLGPWAESLDGAFAVVNLVGESIAQKWTLPAMQAIRESRVESTLILGEAIARCTVPPKFWVNASATGIYGNRGEEELTETSELGPSGEFLVDVCKEWEAAVRSTCRPETQVRIARFGVVLGKDDGMLPIMKQLAKSFLGGQAGRGQQWLSWIHEHDLARMLVWAMADDRPTLFNAVSPTPVRNADFMFWVRHSVKRPWSPPVPAFMIKLGGVFGGPDSSLLLDGARVIPAATLAAGFEFEFAELEKAVEDK